MMQTAGGGRAVVTRPEVGRKEDPTPPGEFAGDESPEEFDDLIYTSAGLVTPANSAR